MFLFRHKLPVLIIFFAVLYTSFLCSCFNSDPNDPELVIFENGFESIQGWTTEPYLNLYRGAANKGRYALRISPDSTSSLFQANFGEIASRPMQVLRFSIWCLSDEIPVNGKIIFEVMADTTRLMVNEFKMDKILLKKKKWTEIRGRIDLFWDNNNSSEHKFVASVSNKGKKDILVDDFRLEFSVD